MAHGSVKLGQLGVVLAPLLEECGSQLNDESFRTLMKEVQAIVNSRPLALNDMSSPDSADPLTPNHLLTMSKVLMPPQAYSLERTSTFARDGEESSTWQMYFGKDGERNFCKHASCGRNGSKHSVICL